MSTTTAPLAEAPSNMKSAFTSLKTKPFARLSYFFLPAQQTFLQNPTESKPTLIVFLNGLGLPQSSWIPAISLITTSRTSHPAILTYDRYGQGTTTDRDPLDESAVDPAHGHDALDVVHDLHQLLEQIAWAELGLESVEKLQLVLVANSIGAAIARLYAQEYPKTVAAMLLLDSVLANSDFVSVWPDPDAPGFDNMTLPEGVTADELRLARKKYGAVFHPSVPNKEGFSRKNLAQLLPHADQPVLESVDGKGVWLTVVGHGFETFAEDGLKVSAP